MKLPRDTNPAGNAEVAGDSGRGRVRQPTRQQAQPGHSRTAGDAHHGNGRRKETGRKDARPEGGAKRGGGDQAPIYAALDLGTNNCRLLIARPTRRGFQVVDAFSRIIRLGEGVAQSGRLSEAAIERTLDALKVCAQKMVRNQVTRSRLVATEACRAASHGAPFS